MLFKKLAGPVIISLLTISMTACNLGATPAPTVDVNAIYTSAAETALAGYSQLLTQTAQAASPTSLPTNTPLATNTPFATLALSTPLGAGTPAGTSIGLTTPLATPIGTLSGPLCNDSAFIADVSVPDGTVMKPGQDFEKIWAIQNTGICRWDEGYALVFVAGDDLDGYNIKLEAKKDFVDPGDTVNFHMDLTASLAEREYTGCWRMRDDGGYYFGTLLCVNIVVEK